nr:MAG TPA: THERMOSTABLE DNA LIGASE [Bacteriophage sp.]
MDKINYIVNQLNNINNISSRNQKLEILVNLLDSQDTLELTNKMFKVALDPMISTFITKFPKYTDPKSSQSVDKLTFIYNLINEVENQRRITPTEWAEVTQMLYNLTDDLEYTYLSKIFTKDLTIGLSLSSYNKAAKLTATPEIWEFDTMRVSNIQDAVLDYESGVYVSVKKDGVNATYEPAGLLRSRNGNLIPIPHLEDQLSQIKGQYVLFGELVSTDRQSSSGLCNSAIKLGYDSKLDLTKLQLHVFDAMTADEYNSRNFTTPFKDRMELANHIVTELNQPDVNLIHHELVHSLDEVYQINTKLVQSGEEGVVINSPEAKFEINRSKYRARIKEVLDGDFEIIDVLPHSKHPDWVGSLTVRSSDGLVVTNTGSGLNEIPGHNKNRIELWQNRDKLIGKIARVKYNKVILNAEANNLSLFIPVLDEIREPEDKSKADSFYELALGSNQTHSDLLSKIK